MPQAVCAGMATPGAAAQAAPQAEYERVRHIRFSLLSCVLAVQTTSSPWSPTSCRSGWCQRRRCGPAPVQHTIHAQPLSSACKPHPFVPPQPPAHPRLARPSLSQNKDPCLCEDPSNPNDHARHRRVPRATTARVARATTARVARPAHPKRRVAARAEHLVKRCEIHCRRGQVSRAQVRKCSERVRMQSAAYNDMAFLRFKVRLARFLCEGPACEGKYGE